METLDIAFRGGATSLLLLFSTMLVARQPNRWIALLGTLMFLSIVGYLWSPVIWREAGMPLWAVPLFFAGHCTAVSFWLFALSVFEDGFKPGWLHGAVFIVVAALWMVQREMTDALAPSFLLASEGLTVEDDIFLLIHLIFIGIVVAAFIKVGSGISTDLVEGRRRLRGWIIVSTGVYILLVVTVEIAIRESATLGLNTLNSASIFILIFVLTVFSMTLHPMGIIVPAVRRKSSESEGLDDAADVATLVRLTTLFDAEKGHHKEGLTIAEVAESLGLPEYRTRRLINHNLGFRNFNALLNEYRIRDACEALKDPEKSRLPILTIALDVGYGSIGPFNRAFKEAMGMTPTEYRKTKNRLGSVDQAD